MVSIVHYYTNLTGIYPSSSSFDNATIGHMNPDINALFKAFIANRKEIHF